MPEPDFDPMDGLTEDDKQYLAGHKKAFERQAAARGNLDDVRKKAAEEHMRATQEAAGVPVTPPTNGARPAPVAAPVASGRISLMVAVPDASGGLPPTTEKFAPDWNSMKEIIAKHNGTWTVSRHEFSAQVADILGFFGKDGWAKPVESEKEVFEAIVKNGRVFRTDPE
jgi:hypothetical protein